MGSYYICLLQYESDLSKVHYLRLKDIPLTAFLRSNARNFLQEAQNLDPKTSHDWFFTLVLQYKRNSSGSEMCSGTRSKWSGGGKAVRKAFPSLNATAVSTLAASLPITCRPGLMLFTFRFVLNVVCIMNNWAWERWTSIPIIELIFFEIVKI